MHRSFLLQEEECRNRGSFLTVSFAHRVVSEKIYVGQNSKFINPSFFSSAGFYTFLRKLKICNCSTVETIAFYVTLAIIYSKFYFNIF